MLPRTGPSTPSTTLADNRRLVLGVLHTRGDLTRTEMAEASGLSPAATARITNALESEGLIARTEKLPSAGGRPAWRYRFTATGRFLAGVRVQGDGCRGALLGWDGQVVARAEFLNDSPEATPEAILDATMRCVARIVKEGADRGRVPVALGVAVPGVADRDGRVRAGTEVGWDDVALGAILTEATRLPVRVENDANALAFSELTPGGATSLAALILGHGLGAGIISDGHLLRGSHSAAGEIGYLLTSRSVLGGGPAAIGDLEFRIQRAARTRRGTAAGAPGQLWAVMGRPEAAATAAKMLDYLAMAIASLVVVIDPGRVVLGDVPPERAERVVAELETRLRGLLLHDPAISLARRGPDAVLIGAGLLAGESVDLQAI